jgi:predicted SnoaL-like aldol condensation-catalyzing enzyme
MNMKTVSLIGFALLLFSTAPAMAQQSAAQANATPVCTLTPAEAAASQKVAMDFATKTGEAKVALADPSYVQHNPANHRRAEQDNLSDYDEFKKTFLGQAAGGGAGGGRGPGAGPQPPPGNPMEIVVAQCDTLVIIHKVYRQDPTAEPGKFYESFTFDAYRVKNGKVTDHWDANTIAPPAPAGRGQ